MIESIKDLIWRKARTMSTKTVNLSLNMRELSNGKAALKAKAKMLERKVAANRMEKDAELQNTIDEQKQHLKDAKAENKVALKEKDEEMKEPPIVIPPITTILLPTTTSTPPMSSDK